MPPPELADSALLSALGFIYLLTNLVRVFTYLPQIVVVWRCTDGARSVSLLTWGSWVLSNVSAVMYGLLVIRDQPFVVISAINLVGCAAVTLVALRRRVAWCREGRRQTRAGRLPLAGR